MDLLVSPVASALPGQRVKSRNSLRSVCQQRISRQSRRFARGTFWAGCVSSLAVTANVVPEIDRSGEWMPINDLDFLQISSAIPSGSTTDLI